MSAVPVALLDAAIFALLQGEFLVKRSQLFKTVQRRAFIDYKNGFLHLRLF